MQGAELSQHFRAFELYEAQRRAPAQPLSPGQRLTHEAVRGNSTSVCELLTRS